MIMRVLSFILGIAFVYIGIDMTITLEASYWSRFGHINIVLIGCLFIVYAFTTQNIANLLAKKIVKIYLSLINKQRH